MNRHCANAFRRRISLVLPSLVALLLLTAAVARADTIIDGTYNFTVTSGGPAPTASFVFDATTGGFVSFTFQWDGASFSTSNMRFGGITSSNVGSPGTWCADAEPSPGSLCGPSSFSMTPGFGSIFGGLSGTFTNGSAVASGTYTVTETSPVPEPSSILLFGTGVAAIVGSVRRKLRR